MLLERLNIYLNQLVDGYTPETASLFMAGLVHKLTILRNQTDDSGWRYIRNLCDRHPIYQMCLSDPFTRRAREKPRGYAGDAGILDFAYFRQPPEDIPNRFKNIFYATTSSVSAQALIGRVSFLGHQIDEVAQQVSFPRVLSLACGHLREVDFSEAIKNVEISELVAIDQDEISLATAKMAYGHLPINFIQGTVVDVLRGHLALGHFNLVYAAGLYDYLDEKIAQKLTKTLFDTLETGGVLIIPNFLYSVPDRGYMESFMDWRLILRNSAQVHALANLIPAEHIREQQYFEDVYACIGYLKLVKV